MFYLLFPSAPDFLFFFGGWVYFTSPDIGTRKASCATQSTPCCLPAIKFWKTKPRLSRISVSENASKCPTHITNQPGSTWNFSLSLTDFELNRL